MIERSSGDNQRRTARNPEEALRTECDRRGAFHGATSLPLIGFIAAAVALTLPTWAQEADERETSLTDRTSYIGRAPGLPDGSIFSGFENNENVSLFNGNLNVLHASSPAYSLDGGRTLQLVRAYNSKNTHWDNGPSGGCYQSFDQTNGWELGDSWVGRGWIMHLGRLFRKSRFESCQGIDPCCPDITTPYYDPNNSFFQMPDGTEVPLEGGGFPLPRRPYLTWSGVNTQSTSAWVKTPDGTEYSLTRIVNELYFVHEDAAPGDSSYQYNYDRSGWYATLIRDVHGNQTSIQYQGTQPYPEALKKITHTFADGSTLVINFDVYTAGDAVNLGDVGRLKAVRAPGFDGRALQWVYHYSAAGYLTSVDLPTESGVPTGTIHYGYDGTSLARLTKIEYPTGGVSRYGYGFFFLGEHEALPRAGMICRSWEPGPMECGTPCVQEIDPEGSCVALHSDSIALWKRESGVVWRRVYPDGDASGKPFSEWTWERDLRLDRPETLGQPPTGVINKFIATSPDGTKTESRFAGYPIAPDGVTGTFDPDDERNGMEFERITKSADGTILRTRRMHAYLKRTALYPYDPNLLATSDVGKEETTYSDDTGVCFQSSGATAKVMTSRKLLDTNWWAAFRMSTTSGAYMKAGETRVVYRALEDKHENACRTSRNFQGAWTDAFIEQGTQRVEWRQEMMGGSTNSCVDRDLIRRRANLTTPSTDFTDPDDPVVAVDASYGASDILADFTWSGAGNLTALDTSGGDADPDPAASPQRRTFQASYAHSRGQATTMHFGGSAIGYDAVRLNLDPSGLISSSKTPSDLETAFRFDALGRLTAIDPPGTVEEPTRVVYPTLQKTRIIRSGGSETDFDAGNPGQSFTEQRYDGLGRSVEVRTARPNGSLSLVLTRFDQMGRTVFVSEAIDAETWDSGTAHRVTWSDGANYSVTVPTSASGTPLGTTTFYGVPSATEPQNPLKATIDGLGRVRKVLRADGSATDTRYCGPHKEVTTTVGTTPAVTRYYYDGLGRLVIVDVEAGAQNPTAVDAVYDYDILGNITKVNLVTSLPSDPFTAWKNSAIADGQVRLFEYDALGRLKKSRIPEAGEGQGTSNADWTWYDRYDALGNLLAWRDPLAAKRGYYFRNQYDSAGRLVKSEKRLGDVGESKPDEDRLAGEVNAVPYDDGDFDDAGDIGTDKWEIGWIDGTTFSEPSNPHHLAAWRRVAYPYPSSGSCVTAPPIAPSGGGLYLGENCSYSAVKQEMQVARILLADVRKDDLLSFSFWRQLRENTTGNLDKFEVFVVLNPSGSTTDDISARRTAFRLTSKQASLAAWQRVTGLQLGALYSDAEWAEGGDTGQVKSLYLYLAFSKGDTASTGVGTGLVVDEVRLGRPGTATLVANTYDVDACFNGAPEACDSGAPNNAFLGTLAKTESYQDGRLVSTRMNVYQGLNGRLSANRIGVDWAGVGQTTNFVTKMSYDSSGNLKYLTNPYIPNIDVGRIYEFGYRRDQFDGVREANGVNFVPFGGTHVAYNTAGGLAELKFNNGVSTVIDTEPAQMYRPRSFKVQTSGSASVYWNSGTYQYDPSGNITAIGGQTFSYDLAGRLVNAQMLPQATAPTESVPNTVSFAYDPYDNIKTQDWSSANATRSAPLFMEFAARQYGPSGTVSRNRITDTDFDYDINGNLRKSNSGGLKHTMLWDARNRMTSVQTGFPGDSAGTTLEARYAYDASGYRTITNPDSGDGKPIVSLRDGSGQLIADYVYSPSSARLILEKDYLYGLGQLLVERRRTSAPPSATTQSGLSSGGNYNLALTSGTGAPSYTLDVRDESGSSSSISSVTPTAQGAFSVPESSLFPDTTNLLRIKKNTGEAEPYSAPLSIAYSPGVTGQSTNTVRAIAISREGTNLVVRWSLAAADGKLSRLHFDRADGGGMVPLNQNALPASITSLTVSDQALAVPCGDFRIERIVPGQSSGTMTEFGVGMPPSSSSQNLTIGNGGGCGEDPPPPPPGGGGPAAYTLADSFHHRDHLGSLRIETDSAGLVMRDDDGVVEIGRHDYYPFGTEMTEDLGVGSRKRFTGHERDEATGMDYMLARYGCVNGGRFLSVDPIEDVDAESPQTWNKYSYVRNDPISNVDPTGEAVYEKVHEVCVGLCVTSSFHVSIRVVPENQAKYATDSRFLTDPDSGLSYATFGAGPVDGKLTSDTNRETDAATDNALKYYKLDIGDRSEDALIESMFAAEARFDQFSSDSKLDYDLFPSPGGEAPWNDGYNSNSFITGFASEVGLELVVPPVRTPGFDKPVPPEMFKKY